MLKTIQSTFDKMINAISKCTNSSDYVNNYIITTENDEIIVSNQELPTVIFGTKTNSYFDENNNEIFINISDSFNSIQEYLESNDFLNVSKVLNTYSPSFAHEFTHYLNSKNKGERHKLQNNYQPEKNKKIQEIFARIKYFLADDKFNYSNDMDYYNNLTERNAFLIQYLWTELQKFINNGTSSFEEFIKPLRKSYFYSYLVPSSKAKTIKRMYYIWNALVKAYPEFQKLDNKDIDSLFKLLNNNDFSEHISTITESESDYATSLIENTEFSCDESIRYIIEQQVESNWYNNRNKFRS